MGPMFYLVQCEGGLPPISAVVLADWPRESFPRPTSGPCADPVGRFGLRWPPTVRRGLLRGKKSLAGNSRHLDGARSALLVTRWICCEDGLKRSKGNMHIEQVSAYFCPPSRGGSPCAALPAGGQARKQKNTRSRRRTTRTTRTTADTTLTADNEDHERRPRRARGARRAREVEGARHEHEHEHRHEHEHKHENEHERQQQLTAARRHARKKLLRSSSCFSQLNSAAALPFYNAI